MKDNTRLVHLARSKAQPESPVNLPVYRASTILSPDLDSYLNRHAGGRRYRAVTYGATGTQNAKALAAAMAELEGGHGCMVTASGLSAVTLGMSAFLSAGDHALVVDTTYGPTRRFSDEVLSRFGVEVEYYAAAICPQDLAKLIRPNTRLLYLEAPGSLTFEMQDVPALAAVARERGVISAMDNTWATPLGFKPIEYGVDISIQAGTKYPAGHSDLVIGMITAATEEQFRRVADHVMCFGDVAGPDDCYLTLRGLRTMNVRLREQQGCAMKIAAWLEEQPAVRRVLYPPLPSDPGHALYQRDFKAGASLFGFTLHTPDLDAVKRMVDGLELFGIGSSWGGYESLVSVNLAPLPRAVTPWAEAPFLARVHIGLEDADDLIADLAAGLSRL